MAAVAYRFRAGVTVQMLAPAIPTQNAPPGIPAENRVMRQFDELALLMQGFLGAHAFRDIAGNRRDRHNLAVRIHYRRHGQGYLNGMAVFMDAHALELLDAGACFDLLDKGRLFLSRSGGRIREIGWPTISSLE